jgi:hypothetical protein
LWNKTIERSNDWLIQEWGSALLTRHDERSRGYEAMNMRRIGQIQGVEKGDILAQAKRLRHSAALRVAPSMPGGNDAESVSQIFGVAA